MQKTKGKFIVLYGINNLGKSTQAKLLVEKLIKSGHQAEYLKYPIYDLEPSGPIINGFLRGGNPYNLTRRDAQFLYALNRTQYEDKLLQKLDSGINIIAEDYVGTGLSWGIGSGVDETMLRNINAHLLKEDMAFLFDGERFKQAVEKNHKHESDNELTDKVRQVYERLSHEFGWIKIDANKSIDEIHDILLAEITKIIKPDTKPTNPTSSASFAHNQTIWEEAVYFDNRSDKLTVDFKKSYIESNAIIKEKIKLESTGKQTADPENIIVEKILPTAKLPTRANEFDAGMDIYSAQNYILKPGEKVMVSTGIKLVIPNSFVGLLWDKGGIAKIGLHTMAGVVDSGYRGEMFVTMVNLSHSEVRISAGQKVAQMLIQKVEFSKVVEGKVDNDTDRGEGKLGSSGLF